MSSNYLSASYNGQPSPHRAIATPPPTQMEPATLEKMPVELKVVILRESPDVSTLYTLVRSSPSYYQIYSRQRQSILHSVLSNTLSPRTLLEFHSVIRARSVQRGPFWPLEVVEFLNNYREDDVGAPHNIGLEDLIEISKVDSGRSQRLLYVDIFHTSTLG